MNAIVAEAKIAGLPISLETGRLAKQADGSVVVRRGDTMVLVTAVSEPKAREGIDFFPLTVNYQERTYSVGKVPGGFFKREARPNNDETLFCRLIDRPIRPLFPTGFQCETQIIANVLSFDGDNEPQLLALIGASAALNLSPIPFQKMIAGVRVSMVDGKIVVFPNAAQREKATMDLMMAASEDAIVMVEGGALQVPETDIMRGLEAGHLACKEIIALQKELIAKAPKVEKRTFEVPVEDTALRARVAEEAGAALDEALRIPAKMERYAKISEVKKQWIADFTQSLGENPDNDSIRRAALYFSNLKADIVRKRLQKEGIRIDGRDTKTVRPIDCQTNLLPRAHGSAVFTRGETQVLATATLGTKTDEQIIDTIRGDYRKSFYLHYNFPPFCVGEVGRMFGPGRREIGHGALAERALSAVLPDHEKFPYTIRIVGETLESNGSSSMATVCGGCLAMMDAGIPIQAPVAGIAMGLIKEGDDHIILSDILGDEDHLGDMDFKVTGTEKGITAIQMDIKIDGLSTDVMEKALAQAREGRIHILGEMAKALQGPRDDLSPYAPRLETMRINPDKIRLIIGPGGETIRKLISETGVDNIDVNDDGAVVISSPDGVKLNDCLSRISALTEEAEVGKLYMGKVRKVVDFGAFVEIFPGTDGLLHISEMDKGRVERVTDILQEGDQVLVECIDVDDSTGKLRLSRKTALGKTLADNENRPQRGGRR